MFLQCTLFNALYQQTQNIFTIIQKGLNNNSEKRLQ